jgi:hypothetical protein
VIGCSIAHALDEYEADVWAASWLKAEVQRTQLLELFPRDGWSSMRPQLCSSVSIRPELLKFVLAA